MPFLNSVYSLFFKKENAETLGFFRILVGVILLITLLLDAPWVAEYYSDSGYFTNKDILTDWYSYRLSILHVNAQPAFVWIMYGLLIISAVFLTIGYKTRLASILTFFLMLSFHERNWLIFTSGDTLLRVLCFYLMMANSGAAYSVDSVLRAMRGQTAVAISRWNRILIKYQASALYFMAAFAKTGAHWFAGNAVSYVLINPYFARTPLYWLIGKPVLGKIMTWGALAIEWTVPFFLWFTPTRLIAIALVVLLQGFIFATMDIGTFPLISIVVVFIFLEKKDLDKFWKMFGRKTYSVHYDGACDFCTQIARGLQAMDVCGKLEFVDFRKNKHDLDMEKQLWLVGDKTYKGFYAFRKMAWLIPALWIIVPFLYLPFAGAIGTKIYNYIACRRFSCKRL